MYIQSPQRIVQLAIHAVQADIDHLFAALCLYFDTQALAYPTFSRKDRYPLCIEKGSFAFISSPFLFMLVTTISNSDNILHLMFRIMASFHCKRLFTVALASFRIPKVTHHSAGRAKCHQGISPWSGRVHGHLGLLIQQGSWSRSSGYVGTPWGCESVWPAWRKWRSIIIIDIAGS